MQGRCTVLKYKIIPKSFTYITEEEEAKLVPLIRSSTNDILSKLDRKDKIIRILKDRTTFMQVPGCGVLWGFLIFFKTK